MTKPVARRRRLRSVGFAVAIALLATLGATARPPLVAAETSPFTDIAGTTFEVDIDWLFGEGITVGCTPTTYCPDRAVSRGEMASFLVRMFDLEDGYGTDAFSDDDGTTHEQDINRLAAAAITVGCTATEFCPTASVRRDEMASFLTRAIPLTDGAGDNYFRDDDDTTHEADIDRAAAAGITNGCGIWRYCIADSVTRGQMAGFLHRVETPVTPPPHPAPTGPLRVETTGSNTDNDCRTAATPCRTIGYATGVAFDDDTIEVGAGTFNEDDIRLTYDVTITGDPGGGTIIHAPSGDRHVPVISGGPDPAGLTVVLAHLTVTGDAAVTGDFAIGIRFAGDGSMSVTDSTISGFRGLGVYVDGPGLTTITDSIISGNGHSGIAGGNVTVNHSTISGNGFGISIGATGAMSVANATVSGNTTGGMFLDQAIGSISDSTISGNAGGAALLHRSTMTMTNATISGNQAEAGFPGGIAIFIYPAIETVLTLRNTLVVGNTSPDTPDIACLDGGSMEPVACPPIAKLNSIVGVPAGMTLADILVPGGLKDNGGPTQTIALTNAASNPAKGKGHAATCAAAPVNGLDQRGLPRTPPCDIGAYELQP